MLFLQLELSSHQPSKFHFSEEYSRIGNLSRSKDKNHVLLFRGLQWFRFRGSPWPFDFQCHAATSIRKNLAEEVGECWSWKSLSNTKMCDVDRQIKRFIGEKMEETILIPKQFSIKNVGLFFLNGLFRWFGDWCSITLQRLKHIQFFCVGKNPWVFWKQKPFFGRSKKRVKSWASEAMLRWTLGKGLLSFTCQIKQPLAAKKKRSIEKIAWGYDVLPDAVMSVMFRRFQVVLPGGILCFHTWCWCSTSHCNEGRSFKIPGAASAASGETPPPQSVGSGDEFGSCTGGGISVSVSEKFIETRSSGGLTDFLFHLSFPVNAFTAALWFIWWANVMQFQSQAATESARESAYLQLLNAVPCRSRIVSKKQNLQREIGYDRLPKWLVRKHHFCDTNFLRRRMSTCAALIDSDNYHFVHNFFHGWFIPWSGLVKKIPQVWAWDNSLIRLLSQDICPVSSINY